MKIGFARNDITPRVGVELCGFGPYLGRRSIGVRDRLWARAMMIDQDGRRAAIISCDLVGVTAAITRRVRDEVRAATGIPHDAIFLSCTHTHSGPTTIPVIGWGVPDEPYIETLPQRIAKAAILAAGHVADATIAHASVPCEGIALNREYDRDAPPLAEVLRDDWRPAKPELTDPNCHVFRVESAGRLVGFLSYFSCHPVVCCQETRYIHGDFVGVATNLIEREHPGSVGLFLLGAQGDVNSCVVHKPEMESMLALDVIAARYARAVRTGLSSGSPMGGAELRVVRRDVPFSHKLWGLDKLHGMLVEKESLLHGADITDQTVTDKLNVRMEMVYLVALRRMVAAAEAGQPLAPPIEMQGLRLGPVSLLGTPFEIFQAIKNEAVKRARSEVPLVMSMVNDAVGYATDRTVTARGGYAADMVPMMLGRLPFANVHEELVEALVGLDAALN